MSDRPMTSLADRIAAATEPSKALSRTIATELAGWHRVEPRHTRSKHGAWISPDDWSGTHSDGSPILDSLHGTTMYRETPHFSWSLDAAMALLREALPGWVICHLHYDPGNGCDVVIAPRENMLDGVEIARDDDLLAMTLCEAIARARKRG